MPNRSGRSGVPRTWGSGAGSRPPAPPLGKGYARPHFAAAQLRTAGRGEPRAGTGHQQAEPGTGQLPSSPSSRAAVGAGAGERPLAVRHPSLARHTRRMRRRAALQPERMLRDASEAAPASATAPLPRDSRPGQTLAQHGGPALKEAGPAGTQPAEPWSPEETKRGPPRRRLLAGATGSCGRRGQVTSPREAAAAREAPGRARRGEGLRQAACRSLGPGRGGLAAASARPTAAAA